eukprot:7776788-Pyramimonas_sp.AAC.2
MRRRPPARTPAELASTRPPVCTAGQKSAGIALALKVPTCLAMMSGSTTRVSCPAKNWGIGPVQDGPPATPTVGVTTQESPCGNLIPLGPGTRSKRSRRGCPRNKGRRRHWS